MENTNLRDLVTPIINHKNTHGFDNVDFGFDTNNRLYYVTFTYSPSVTLTITGKTISEVVDIIENQE